MSEKPSSSLTSTVAAREVDPLLQDLNEKKQSFRRNVVSLAVELKELRSRLASQEQSYAKETLTRQVRDFLFLFFGLFYVSFCSNTTHFCFFFVLSLFGQARKVTTLMSIISTFWWSQGKIIEFFGLAIFFYRFSFTGSRDKCQEHGIANWKIAEELGRKK